MTATWTHSTARRRWLTLSGGGIVDLYAVDALLGGEREGEAKPAAVWWTAVIAGCPLMVTGTEAAEILAELEALP